MKVVNHHSLVECNTEHFFTNTVSIISFAFCIPLYELLIYPFIRNRIPRTTVRIALGFLVAILGMSSLLAVDVAGHYPQVPFKSDCMFYANATDKIWIDGNYLIPIIVIMAFGEMLASISTLEFIVAQSPYGMRGLMIGINFMLYGVFVGFGATVLTAFSLGFKHAHPYTLGLPSCGTSFLMAVVSIGCVGALAYLYFMGRYKERQRGGQVDINYQTILEGYYESQQHEAKF